MPQKQQPRSLDRCRRFFREKGWHSIPSLDGEYSASSDGCIRSEERKQWRGDRSYTIRQRVLSDYDDGHGYRRLLLGRGRWRLVHRLVAEAFLGPYPAGQEVNHKDGNKANNRIANLEYVTPQQNNAHALFTGLIDNRGERNHFSRLRDNEVLKIRQLAGSSTTKDLSAEFGVNRATISRIVRRKTWKHL